MHYVQRDVLMNLTHFVERDCPPSDHVNPVGVGAPEPAKCRAKHLISGKPLALCLSGSGTRCGFSSWFGDELLCYHPERGRIIQRTLARMARRR